MTPTPPSGTTTPATATPPGAGILPGLAALAVVVARSGELPPGALEAITEAGGAVLVIGDGAQAAVATATAAPATRTTPATRAWWCDTGPGLHPAALAAQLRPVLAGVALLVLPGTPDGRDLAPRLAAALDRPLLANACRAQADGGTVRADLCRLDDRIIIPAEADGPVVVTLAPGTGTIGPPPRTAGPPSGPVAATELALPEPPAGLVDVTVLEVLEPDPSTMDLAEAPLVFGGGAGLAAGLDFPAAQAAFGLLTRVAAAVGASAGATRVATDAGWIGHDRQIGTTGVSVRPKLYVAFGVSGATQHTGGLGAPDHIASINTDPHCPMTAMSSLGIIADARGTLAELAAALGVEVAEVPEVPEISAGPKEVRGA
jgi:electron transfer flavoprotein alpha subunit